MMKEKCKKGVEIVVESVNFIIITYALSSVSMSLRSSWVYILFFESNVWLITMYCNTINKTVKNRLITTVLCLACIIIFCVIVYYFGYIDGQLVRFKS